MRITEIITEAVGGNYLYHGVPDGRTVAAILKSGFIEPQEQFEQDCDDLGDRKLCPPVISLSRNQYLRYPAGRAVAQFVVDKDALKQAGIVVKPWVGAGYFKSESEERAYKPIPLRSPFVVAIQFDPNLKIPKSVLNRTKELGVPIVPWKSFSQPVEPEYDLQFHHTSGKGDSVRLSNHINDILKKGTEPLPDWTQLKIIPMKANKAGIYYNIPGWTYGTEIQPFNFIDADLAEKILSQLQQLTKAGKSIRPIMNKYSLIQHDKNWKQGTYQLRPGDPGFKVQDNVAEDQSVPAVLYHGGRQLIDQFKIPPYGVFFSPHIGWAKHYGPIVTAAKVDANKIYLVDYSHDIDEDIFDALLDRDYETVAKFIKLLKSQGYQALQTVSDSEMVVVFPGTAIQVLDN